MAERPQESAAARHLRGNAEAVLIMTEALIDRHASLLGSTEHARIRGALSQLKDTIERGSEAQIRAVLAEFDEFSERLAKLVGGPR